MDTYEWIIRSSSFWGALLFFLSLEKWIPFRKPVQSKLQRAFINLGIGITNALLLSFTTGLILIHFSKSFFENKIGLLNRLEFPFALNLLITFILFDLALYGWHTANHNVPFLWRFHQMHHTDLDVDITTASRFHIGELFISSILKLGLIFLIGPSSKTLFTFDALFLVFTQFNHSNIKIPRRVERLLETLIITPFIHRSHHSAKSAETNSNYGTIFSFWDKIFGTFHLKEDQQNLKIGLEEFQDKRDLTFGRLWVIPIKLIGHRTPFIP